MNVKEITNIFSNNEFVVKLLQLLRDFELLDDISIRNALIRKEWIESKQMGEPNKDFMERAAEKFCISTKTIDSILYSRKKYKSINTEIREINEKLLNELQARK